MSNYVNNANYAVMLLSAWWY